MKGSAWLAVVCGVPLMLGVRADVIRTQASIRGARTELPAPRSSGQAPLERVLSERRSVREYAPLALRLDEIAQLAWAAQGVSAPDGRRTAPSAGALHPLELYVVAGSVDGLSVGVHRYEPGAHRLVQVGVGDRRVELCAAALDQEWVRAAPALLVLAAVPERTTIKYGERGVRYVHIEVGCAAQNAWLQATALGLGAVLVGAFDDARVRRALDLPRGVQPLALMPVGRPR